MEHDGVTVFERSIETCADPAEIARKVKLAFKRMPGEMALACFAKVMTAELPHPIKVAVWDAVRYSHIWWGVDGVLHGGGRLRPNCKTHRTRPSRLHLRGAWKLWYNIGRCHSHDGTES